MCCQQSRLKFGSNWRHIPLLGTRLLMHFIMHQKSFLHYGNDLVTRYRAKRSLDKQKRNYFWKEFLKWTLLRLLK